jgi:hypothetical protein
MRPMAARACVIAMVVQEAGRAREFAPQGPPSDAPQYTALSPAWARATVAPVSIRVAHP